MTWRVTVRPLPRLLPVSSIFARTQADSAHTIPFPENRLGSEVNLGCIQFIKQIKWNVPFFESSPMLNDISYLSSWVKNSSGLLWMYEAEVLDKLPVVQHFKFGTIFRASWTPSQTLPPSAPTTTPFSLHTSTNAPIRRTNDTEDNGNSSSIPSTRAPWAT